MTDKDERIAELERENQALEARVDALNKKVKTLTKLVIGEQRTEDGGLHHPDLEDAVNFFDRMEGLEDEFEDIETTARSAIATTDTAADGGQTGKKQMARNKARNRLIVNLARSSSPKQKMKFTTVIDEIKRAEIAYQSVKDACEALALDWDAFEIGTDEEGDKVIKVFLNDVTKELTYRVEEDLARDDLTKRLISQREQGGAKP